jgi:hypothetical protein
MRPFPATAISQSGSAELAGEKDAKPTTTVKAIAQVRQAVRMSWRSRRLLTERGTPRIAGSDLPSLDTSVVMFQCALHGFQMSALAGIPMLEMLTARVWRWRKSLDQSRRSMSFSGTKLTSICAATIPSVAAGYY